MIFISERNKEDRCFGRKLEKGEVIRGEDFFFGEHYDIGTKSKKDEGDLD